MARPETTSKTVDYNTELVKFKSYWGDIPESLAPELGHFYATAPIRVREMAWIEGADYPETYYHAVNALADYCSILVSMKSSPSKQNQVLVGNTLKYMLQEEARGRNGGRLLDFLQLLGWPYGKNDVNEFSVDDFRTSVLSDLQRSGQLPAAEKCLVLDLINQYTCSLKQSTNRTPMYYYCSPDIFAISQILAAYGFKLSSPTFEYHSEAEHLLQQMEDSGNIKGIKGLKQAMTREPDKWIFKK